MINLYNVNALVHWEEREIEARERMTRFFAAEVSSFLKSTNPAWDIRRVEAPLLVPRDLLSSAYGNDDLWVQEGTERELSLRPETTPTTYAYMTHLLASHQKVRPPLCVWQAGKSFRREQEQPIKHMRLKEFHQMEFQAAYTEDTKNDYHAACLEPMRRMLAAAINLPTRIVESDRLPAYSLITMDIEVDNGDKWMEVASISLRTDFPATWRTTNRQKDETELKLRVLEIAIGLDRCVYNWSLMTDRI